MQAFAPSLFRLPEDLCSSPELLLVYPHVSPRRGCKINRRFVCSKAAVTSAAVQALAEPAFMQKLRRAMQGLTPQDEHIRNGGGRHSPSRGLLHL